MAKGLQLYGRVRVILLRKGNSKGNVLLNSFDKMFSGWNSYYKKTPVVSGDFSYYKIEFLFNEPVNEPVKLDDNLNALLVLLNNNPYSTNNELALAINKSRATITRYIKKLKSLLKDFREITSIVIIHLQKQLISNVDLIRIEISYSLFLTMTAFLGTIIMLNTSLNLLQKLEKNYLD